MVRMLRVGRPSESGIAMVTAILVSAVILTLSITAASLAVHNTDQSGVDRQRTQVVATAEAGINVAFSTLQTTPTAQLPCSLSANSTAAPAQQYAVTIQYYDASGNPMTCLNPGVAFAPAKAVITSTGNSLPVAVRPNAKRTMQSEVGLRPVYGGFDQAIFSDTSPSTSNNLTVNGDVSDDADVYTNGSWSCNNSFTAHGQMIAQGSVTMTNSCQVTKDIWANGSVSMSNSALAGHNVTSSTSSITLDNSSQIVNNATAGTTISGSNIGGTKTPNHPQAAPPSLTLPTVSWVPSAWTSQTPPWTVNDNQTCSAVGAVTTVSTNTVYHISPTCSLTYSNNTTITLNADMAIVTSGSIGFSNKTTWQSGDGNVHTLYMLVPTGSACPGGKAAPGSGNPITGLRRRGSSR